MKELLRDVLNYVESKVTYADIRFVDRKNERINVETEYYLRIICLQIGVLAFEL